MHSIKFLSISVVIVLVTGAVYSSSAFIAFGAVTCKAAANGIDQICITSIKNGKIITGVDYCYEDKDGKRVCIHVYDSPGSDTGSDLPPELSDALDAAVAESQNTTKVPEGALNDSSLLMGEDDNQTASKAIVPTQDRFCVEGTGGSTGKTCIRCDPGLDFEVGCVDVLTGGPLDMGTKSESEASNDTAGGNDDSKLSEDFGGLEFGDNTTKPELQ